MERTKKGINVKRFFNRSVSYLILLVSIFALCYSVKQIYTSISLKNEQKELQDVLTELKDENNHLKVNNAKLQNKDYFSIYVKDKYQYSTNGDSIIPVD